MVLYCRVSLNAFVESFRNTSGPDSFFTLPAKGLMHIVPQEEIEYGLSLLRESIGLYEERKGIPVEKSKKAMPFFRQDSRMLVGPEIGMYVIPLYEKPGEPASLQIRTASSPLCSGCSVPGTTGTPAAIIRLRAEILSPIASIVSAAGPINTIPSFLMRSTRALRLIPAFSRCCVTPVWR